MSNLIQVIIVSFLVVSIISVLYFLSKTKSNKYEVLESLKQGDEVYIRGIYPMYEQVYKCLVKYNIKEVKTLIVSKDRTNNELNVDYSDIIKTFKSLNPHIINRTTPGPPRDKKIKMK